MKKLKLIFGIICAIVIGLPLLIGFLMTLPEILKTPGGSQMFLKIILGLAASIGLIFFYFLPSVIAQKRKHPQAVPIKIINTFFGWTLI